MRRNHPGVKPLSTVFEGFHPLVTRALFLAVSVLLLASYLIPLPALAQEAISSGIATYIPIKTSVHEGDIIRLTKNGYDLARSPYEPSIFGIVVEKPSVSFETADVKDARPVVSTGKVYVRVSTINGPIKKGDLITASSIPGVGQKATDEGYVLGTALQGYDSKNPDKIGKILVVLNISFNPGSGGVKTNLFASLSQALTAPYLSPLNALRYALAAVLVISSFVIGVGFFGKVSTIGVEAIGRNPLASRLILLSVILHLLLAAAIILIGVAIAYFVLVI